MFHTLSMCIGFFAMNIDVPAGVNAPIRPQLLKLEFNICDIDVFEGCKRNLSAVTGAGHSLYANS